MQETTHQPTISCRYCPSLDSNVVLLKRETAMGEREKVCLCAHLCEKDRRLLCPHHDEKKADSYDF